jgi:hypothetical protein
VLLLAAASCHAGMAALPDGMPALKGLALRPWSEAVASVPAALLTEAGLGVTFSLDEEPLNAVPFVVGVDAGALGVVTAEGRLKEALVTGAAGVGFIR